MRVSLYLLHASTNLVELAVAVVTMSIWWTLILMNLTDTLRALCERRVSCWPHSPMEFTLWNVLRRPNNDRFISFDRLIDSFAFSFNKVTLQFSCYFYLSFGSVVEHHRANGWFECIEYSIANGDKSYSFVQLKKHFISHSIWNRNTHWPGADVMRGLYLSCQLHSQWIDRNWQCVVLRILIWL